MIIKLKGRIEYLGADYLIMMVNGVGYKVESAATFRLGLEGAETEVYTYTHVSEREMRLFGFGSLAELKLFEKLLTVSGVGPKSAMLLVANHSLRKILTAVRLGQPETIAVKGLGSKTLAKIAIELKGKLESLEALLVNGESAGSEFATERELNQGQLEEQLVSDLALALNSLGYKEIDYRKILPQIQSDLALAEQLKQALKLLRA